MAMESRIPDRDWEFYSKYLSKLPERRSRVGRPRASDRELFEGIVWVLNFGFRWRDLPHDLYPAKSSCHRRFQEWSKDGSWNRIQRAMLFRLKHKGKINSDEAFVDGSFIRAKKGATM